MSELDLEHGDANAAERIAAAGSARHSRVTRERKESGDSSGTTSGTKRSRGRPSKAASTKASENSLASQLVDAFGKLADQLQAREDDELATAIREEAEGMTVGLISATRIVPFFRKPLVLILGIAVPVLAFWRVGGILLRRELERRARKMQPQEPSDIGNTSAYEYVQPVETVPGTGY